MSGYDHRSSLALIGLLAFHEGALDYDLRTRTNLCVDDVYAGRVAWNTVAGIVDELLRDPYSHVTASVHGWSHVPSPQDVMFLNWVDATASMHHRSGQVRPQPVKRPWEHGGRPKTTTARVDPEREKRRAALRDRLGID